MQTGSHWISFSGCLEMSRGRPCYKCIFLLWRLHILGVSAGQFWTQLSEWKLLNCWVHSGHCNSTWRLLKNIYYSRADIPHFSLSCLFIFFFKKVFLDFYIKICWSCNGLYITQNHTYSRYTGIASQSYPVCFMGLLRKKWCVNMSHACMCVSVCGQTKTWQFPDSLSIV